MRSPLCPLILALLVPLQAFAQPAPKQVKVDVCVYGGTSAGVIAAVAVKKEGKSVVLVEPGRHLGGMTSGGLGWTDFGNKAVIGGMSLAFYREIGRSYARSDATWTFEPHVAERVYRDLVERNRLDVLFEHRLKRAEKDGSRLTRLTFEHAPPQDTGAPAPLALPGSAPTVV